MDLETKFKKETGFDAYADNDLRPKVPSDYYVEWLEAKINYTHCCKSDSEQLLAYTEFLREELHLNISDTWVESYKKNKKK